MVARIAVAIVVVESVPVDLVVAGFELMIVEFFDLLALAPRVLDFLPASSQRLVSVVPRHRRPSVVLFLDAFVFLLRICLGRPNSVVFEAAAAAITHKWLGYLPPYRRLPIRS